MPARSGGPAGDVRYVSIAGVLTPGAQHWLRVLEVRDFRNLPHVVLTLPLGGLVIVGDNGQGKTNLLEAIAYLHLLRSVRAARDIDVVRFGAPGFSVRGEATRLADPADGRPPVTRPAGPCDGPRADHTIVVGFERATRRKRVTVNGTVPERLSDALGCVPSVTFSPIDVDLVRGAPSGRRRYLDVVLATTSRRYLAALQQYRGALIRRNAALRGLGRQPGVSKAALDGAVMAWEPLLADAGAVLWAERAAWAAEWAPELAGVSRAIGEREAVRMRYVARVPRGGRPASVAEPPGAPVTVVERTDRAGDFAVEVELKEALEAALAADRLGDLRHGSTRIGPHRDDLVLTLGERELRTYGSAGQQRTVAIGLRILEAAALRSRGGAAPVLLFDDPFAELDERRSRAILDVLAGGGREGDGAGPGPIVGQVILAVPRPADIPAGLTRLTRARIEDGSVTGVAG